MDGLNYAAMVTNGAGHKWDWSQTGLVINGVGHKRLGHKLRWSQTSWS